jgi:hypothetical protein
MAQFLNDLGKFKCSGKTNGVKIYQGGKALWRSLLDYSIVGAATL